MNKNEVINVITKYFNKINLNPDLLIDAIISLSDEPEKKYGYWKIHRDHVRIIYDIPPEGPEPPYHRKITPTYKCSECGYISFDFAPNFCEECGADMRGEVINDG